MHTEALQDQAPPMAAADSLNGVTAGDLRESSATLSLAAVFQTLIRERRQLGIVALPIFLLLALLAFLLPNTYTATASFIPPPSNSGGLSSLASQLSSAGAGAVLGAVKNNGDLYVGMLGSHTVADRLVSRFHLMQIYKVKRESQAIKRLAAHSNFEVGVRDGIVTVKVTDKSPERARDLANGYLEELRYVTGQLAISEAAQRRLFFEQQLTREKDSLADAEVTLKQLQEKTGLIAPVGQTQVGISTVAQTRAAIASRQVQLAGLKFSLTNDDPRVARLHDEIAELQSQLSTLQKGIGQSSSVDVPASQVPQVELEFVRQERELKYHEALFQMIAKQYESARLDESHDAPTLQVLDLATVPDVSSGPPRTAIIAVGLFLGITVGILFILAIHRSWMPRTGLHSPQPL